MAIDWTKGSQQGDGLTYDPLWTMRFADLGGIEVAWVRVRGENYDTCFLMSERDFPNSLIGGPRDVPEEAHQEALRRARDARIDEMRGLYAATWAELGPKEAVFDIAARVWDGAWLGQRDHKVVYAQDIARLLDFPAPHALGESNPVWRYLRELRDEERLDVDGAIVVRHPGGFRLPAELRSMFAYIVEEPIGWPNGGAGDGLVLALESAISDSGKFRHGSELLGPANYPHLSPRYLMMFGLAWARMATDAAEAEGRERLDYPLDSAIGRAEELVRRLRALQVAGAQGAPERPEGGATEERVNPGAAEESETSGAAEESERAASARPSEA
jgi:flavin-binding protein dodecin